jgi:hypothetical protein
MTEEELEDKLEELGVIPPDVLRSVLYLDFLKETRTYLTETLAEPAPDGLGEGYGFVEEALGSANLLNELAHLLDEYAGAAVADYLGRHITPNYDAFFLNVFLNDHFQTQLGRFWKSYPATEFALRKLTDNFKSNLCKVCERIVADQKAIQTLFGKTYLNLKLTRLKQIESTGSDFHKGGQQVLILTFSSQYWRGQNQCTADFKLVYKPSDLEVDCRLTGNSEAVNLVMPDFMTESLVEIFNRLVRQKKKEGDQNSMLEELRTYHILPRNPTSACSALDSRAIRLAYGYLEFLGYDYPTVRLQFNDKYGSLMILHEQVAKPFIYAFYRRLGQWVALASTFSFTDMHIENVRVNQYMPLLIDLEVSLITAVTDVSDTLCFADQIGGITGESINAGHVAWQLTEDKELGRYFLEKRASEKVCQNRLWALRPAWGVVDVDKDRLLEGFNGAIDLLGQGVNANEFDTWFKRLQGVLVRYVPLPTSTFQKIRNDAFLSNVGREPTDTLRYELETQFNSEFNYYEEDFNTYEQQKEIEKKKEEEKEEEITVVTGMPPRPNFISLQPEVVLGDFLNLDIPVFYHRIGTKDIVDSQGRTVPIPENKLVKLKRTVGNETKTGDRNLPDTFFQNAPTDVNIQRSQLEPLGNVESRTKRKETLIKQIKDALGVSKVSQNFQALIQPKTQ